MHPPFTIREFLHVFALYNEAVWPAPLILGSAAGLAVALALLNRHRSRQWISSILAALWAWMGLVYHWAYFAPINPAAYLFGALFLVQAAVFLWAGVVHSYIRLRARFDVFGVAGGALIAYALFIYPVVAYLVGHSYPEAPTFGLPCPTTIFTIGLLLWTDHRLPVWVIAIPVIWSGIGSVAAFSLKMTEDFGLLVSGLAGVVLMAWNSRRVIT